VTWFPQVGDTVGRYRITDVLGQGGMGVVFVAVAPDLERPVALKVLAPQAAVDPRLRERFAREAATLARLDSPHIVYILEYGEQDGCPYLVTQLVPDGDLRHHLDEHGPLSPRQAADVMEQVAAGLEEAHSHGVVHRDLKSANILLRRLPGGDFHAYLCDFGIARADSHETTSASGVVGTLEYLAPERQSGAPASFATDIYSLGCLLWAAVTGAPPYRGSEVDVAVAHLRAPIPQLPGDDPVSRSTNAIVARAMAKKPGDRYASAHEMRQQLVSLGALATEQEDQSAPSSAADAKRRRTAAVALAGVAVAAIVLAGTVWLVRGPSAAPSSQRDVESSVATPSASSASQRRCWNGPAAKQGADCPAPSGVQGLQWVYPDFKRVRAECRRVARPLSPRKVRAFFCPFTIDNPDEGIRYSEWDSAASAREVIGRDFYWPEKAVERDGYTWSVWIRESGDERGAFSSAVAYRDWPFSAEVETNTKRAAILACNTIDHRQPETFGRVRSLCESPA
jgi:serine/threonine protein kinase